MEANGLCVSHERSCESCGLPGKLNCRFQGLFWGFIIPSVGFIVCSFAGLILLGNETDTWWPAVGYALFLTIFFGLLETRVLCSHCPYYSRKGRILRCPVNYGLPRIWGFRPWPLSLTERVAVVATFVFFGAFPLLVLSSSIITGVDGWRMVVLFLAALFFLGTTASVLAWRYCPRCINFSCPFNRVPGALVHEYAKTTTASLEA